MRTRLAIFCDKILEAGWLAALIVAPLFFDVYSSRVFEPDKISLVRSLALLMIVAWVVKQIETGMRMSFRGSLRTLFRDNPLMLPTLAVVVAYIIATVFSVAPEVSFWGSYQRLQGTYTTLSYIAIFSITASSLRTRAQLNRAIDTILVVSLPIALYGVLQHFDLDPLPWGGDVKNRIASNMGNSIFVAAYMIMIVPLALARGIETMVRLQQKINLRNGLLAVTYAVIIAALFVAIFFTQSRGPWLGFAGGLFTFTFLYALARGARRIALGAVGLAAVVVAFLAIFNLPSSPLDPLKQVPYIGRLGQIFETESGTGKVRELIWQGAIQLVLPHAPLWSPTTGDDALNAIRPLVGYGPEAMYVAYNPFYPPDLAHYEQRNAAPDRSHNETFDALVMTGLFGFAAYILLFISVFYFGLKWLGMISTAGERNAFIAVWLVSGFVSALGFGLWRGWNFIGVALPFGMIIGFFVFLVSNAIRRQGVSENGVDPSRALWLCAIIAAFIGHFIEIHFGIAIVSTRLYFWFYAALLVIFGMDRIAEPAAVPRVTPPVPHVEANAPRNRKRRRVTESARPNSVRANAPSPFAPVLAWTMIVTLILITLAFEFISLQPGANSPLEVVRRSLFVKGNETSPAIFFFITLTWVVAGIIGLERAVDPATPSGVARDARWLAIALFAVLSFTAVTWFVLFQSRALAQPGDPAGTFNGLLALYYVALFLIVGAIAVCLWLGETRSPIEFSRTVVNAAVIPILTVALGVLVYLTNFSNVSADIIYKAGTNFDSAGLWDRSIDTYERALQLQPQQDFYLLFLGRAYLEAARTINDPQPRVRALTTSEQRLLRAQQLNPLNTDHSANLARLHRFWSGMIDDPAQKAVHLQKSSDYYQIATRLSPNTPHLRNEWSQTYIQIGDLEGARVELERSLKLDQQFPQTYVFLGDYYRTQRDNANAAENYFKAIALDPNALSDNDGNLSPGPLSVLTQPDIVPRAIEAYRAASEENPNALTAHYALAELYRRSGQLDRARQELEQTLQAAPNDLSAHLQLVNFLSLTGQIDAAVDAMRRLLDSISPGHPDYQRFQGFYVQLQNLQRAIQAAQKSPSDVNAHRSLATLWKSRDQPQFALSEYQTVARLMPNDYDAQKNIALLNLVTNHLDDAQRALTLAASLAPDNEKGMWQNLQMALNNQKTQQYVGALEAAQAALSLAADADKQVLQVYAAQLQAQVASSKP